MTNLGSDNIAGVVVDSLGSVSRDPGSRDPRWRVSGLRYPASGNNQAFGTPSSARDPPPATCRVLFLHLFAMMDISDDGGGGVSNKINLSALLSPPTKAPQHPQQHQQHQHHASVLPPALLAVSSVTSQQQIILRLPDDLAARVRAALAAPPPKAKKDKDKDKDKDKGKHHPHDNSSSSSSSSTSSSSSAQPEHGKDDGKHDELVIDVQPQGSDADALAAASSSSSSSSSAGGHASSAKSSGSGLKYLFLFQGERYYAMLANLPTNVETHKTFDKKVFIKVRVMGCGLWVMGYGLWVMGSPT